METKSNSNAGSGCSAATCSACDGCQWQHEGETGNWCYMFGHRPVMLPCTQHDKFKATRDMISDVVRKRPEIMAHSEPNDQGEAAPHEIREIWNLLNRKEHQ